MQEYFIADLVVSKFVKSKYRVATLLQYAGEPLELFGVTKWHNVLKFTHELLALEKEQTALAAFADCIFSASPSGRVCPLHLERADSREMGVPGASALGPLLAVCTLESISLDVSDVLANTAHSDGTKSSSILGKSLEQNTCTRHMKLQGIIPSDLALILRNNRCVLYAAVHKPTYQGHHICIGGCCALWIYLTMT